MTATYTEQAIQIIERQLKVAARDGGKATNRGMEFTPKGYIFFGGNRIGHDAAVQTLAYLLETEAAAPKTTKAAKAPKAPAGPMTWDKLNANTQAFFFALCERIQEQTRDHGMTVPARIGKDGIGLTLAQCPLLTNLKRSGLVEGLTGEKKSHKLVVLTDAGRVIWQSHV